MGCIPSVLKWLNFLLIIMTGISFAAPYFPPATFWPFIFLGLGFPVLILLNIAFVLFWLYLKKWYFMLSLICLIMSWSAAGKFIGNPFKSIPQQEGTEIKILSYNAQGGNMYYKKLYDDFNEVVLNIDADVICFQEINPKSKKLTPIFSKYPYIVSRGAQCVISKYPIEKHKDLELEKIKTSNGAMWADVKVNNQIIRIYNIHLHSNKISSEVDELSENTELNELNDKEKWTATKGILAQVKNAAAVRAQQSITIKESINDAPHPIVLCGDFNDPPQSYTYRILSKNLNDSFEEAGKGLGFTYNGNIPFLKIDFILTSPSLAISANKIVPSKVSDHKPIVTTLVLPTK